MRRVVLTVCVALLAGAPSARAGGPYMWIGAADDVVLQRDSGFAKSRMDLAKLAGLDTLRVSVQWSRGDRTLDGEAALDLDNAIAAAKLDGIRVVLSLYPFGSSVTPLADADRDDFTAWVGDVVRRYPSVRDVIVGNEPNLNRFWLPQFGPSGEDVAAPAYVALLAQAYDAIKAIRPNSTVYGGALAPRGVDRPNTARDTHSPTAFVLDMGAAYRASGRLVPIMDAFAFHPYADASNVPPSATHPNSTSIGIADYDKLVSLLGQAFDGTAQRGSTLPILYDEFGVESDIPPLLAGLYGGTEATTVHPVDEATQASFYAQALQLAFCQPTVLGLLLFHYVDESARSGWQSGLYYVDGTPKSSRVPVTSSIDETRRGVVAECSALRLTPKVALATTVPAKGTLRVAVTPTIDVRYTLRLQRVPTGAAPRVVLTGTAPGRRTTTLKVARRLSPGRYRWTGTATALENAGPPAAVTGGGFTVR